MPGLRRLLDPRPDAEGDARLRRAEGEHRVHLRHRLLEPAAVLHEHLRLPHDPRPRADDRDRPQGRAARTSWSGSSPATATRCRSAATTCSTRCAATSTCTMVMFNNRIYGLTKGQTSPTSELGKRTKSTPMGSIDRPMMPLTVALGRRGDLRRPLGRHPHRAPPAHARGAPAGTAARRSSRSSRTATSSTTAPGATSPSATSATTGCSSSSTASR